MKTVRISYLQEARIFETKEEAFEYVTKFVPEIALPEVVSVDQNGQKIGFGIYMLYNTKIDSGKRLFEIRAKSA